MDVKQKEDGSFQIEWDREDPQWSWLNGLTSEQIQCIMEAAIRDSLENDD